MSAATLRVPSPIRVAFRAMAIADESIRGRKGLDWLFPLLRPTAPLLDRIETLYRPHCVELVARAVRGVDLRPATDAELLGLLADSSLRIPPDAAAQVLYSRLFVQHVAEMDTSELAREPFSGAVAERETEMRRRAAQAWRVKQGLDHAEA